MTVTVAATVTVTDSREETVQLVVPLHRVMPGRGRVQKQAAMAALQWTLTARENHSSLATASTAAAATSRRRRRRRVLGVGIVDEGPRAVHGQR